MSIGMTPEQFWCGPPRLAKVYREAEIYRLKRENVQAWRMGQYVLSALQAVIGSAFAKNKSQVPTYVAEPLPLNDKEVAERKARDEREAEERIIEKMERLVGKPVSSK